MPRVLLLGLARRHYRSLVCQWRYFSCHLHQSAILLVGEVYGSAYHYLVLERSTFDAVYDVETRESALGHEGWCRERTLD